MQASSSCVTCRSLSCGGRGYECHGPRHGVECSAGLADDDVAALRQSLPLADSFGVAADAGGFHQPVGVI